MNLLPVILADDLCSNGEGDGVLKQMIEVYNKYQCSVVAICEVPKEETQKYGVIDGSLVYGRDDIYRVHNMVEKPTPEDAPSNLAIIGRYILNPRYFRYFTKYQGRKGGRNSDNRCLDGTGKR